MSNRAVFRLFLAVGIIFGAVRACNDRCRNCLEDLKTERSRLKEDWENTRLDLKGKEANNQLTEEHLTTTVNGVIIRITDLKTKIEAFCNKCPHDKCSDILSQMERGINTLKYKLNVYKEKDGELTVNDIMPVSAPGDAYAEALG
ncbi:uncharacterized protein LOC144646367 isoform X1 [Oculina patagonica]